MLTSSGYRVKQTFHGYKVSAQNAASEHIGLPRMCLELVYKVVEVQ